MPVNVTDGNGWTAVHYALIENRTDVIEHLLNKEADMNRQTRSNENTPLHWAARYNYTEAD